MSIKVRISYSKPKPDLNEGDIRTTLAGRYVRRQLRVNGGFAVSGGRPIWEWLRFADAPADHKGRPKINYCGYTKESQEALKIAVKIYER